MTIPVWIGIYHESVCIDKMMMPIGIQLGEATTFPFLHSRIREEHMRIDTLHLAIGHKPILHIPYIMRNHTRSW